MCICKNQNYWFCCSIIDLKIVDDDGNEFLAEKLVKFVLEVLVLFVVIGKTKKLQMKFWIQKDGFVPAILVYWMRIILYRERKKILSYVVEKILLAWRWRQQSLNTLLLRSFGIRCADERLGEKLATMVLTEKVKILINRTIIFFS